MADRQDIDALMVGALYGELDTADSARLDAHLSSHPEDRVAMQGLERTRATVRRGLADLPSAEPPQAISAVLLQAAHQQMRPARAAVATEPEAESAWTRFVAWFRRGAMHPAMAAAAALILVAGTATALWVRGKGGVTEPKAKHSAADKGASEAPSTDSVRSLQEKTTQPPSADPATAAGSGGDAFAVDVEQAEDAEGDVGGLANDRKRVARSDGKATGKGGKSVAPTALGYLDGKDKNSDELAVKEPAPEEESLKLAPPRPADVSDDAATGEAAAPRVTNQVAREPGAVDPAVEEWARNAHVRLVSLVKDGKCPDAGRLGAEIKDRAPEYYAANVATDRNIRQCKQYIEGRAKKKAEKDYKSRSQGNVADESMESL